MRAALLIAIMQTPHRFRTKRLLWAYSGLGRPDTRNLFQQLASCVFAALGEQFTPRLLPQRLEEIQLLIQSFGSSPQPRLG